MPDGRLDQFNTFGEPVERTCAQQVPNALFVKGRMIHQIKHHEDPSKWKAKSRFVAGGHLVHNRGGRRVLKKMLANPWTLPTSISAFRLILALSLQADLKGEPTLISLPEQLTKHMNVSHLGSREPATLSHPSRSWATYGS
eukprot:GHVN01019234.1.p1 GENE.GHVN01019234.1~~GHVN01019234.1.p1  ORF type:complete len:141 (-),score=7.94 GHVN01019234.1:89-511(-)